MLIDFHTHCFPDALAPRAIERLSHGGGGLEPHTDGTLAGLRARMAADGVDIAVVLNIATNAAQQHKVNDFAASLDREEGLVAFGSVYPDAPDALDELERIAALGLRGVKLHPDFQGFAVDDERYAPLYRKISSLGLITIFHAGVDYNYPPPYGGTPARIAAALRWFDTPVVAAHWGGIQSGEEVLRYLAGRPVYLDTSFGYATMPKHYAAEILCVHGAERMLFGTDTPWHTVAMEERLLGSLDISDEDMQRIRWKNAAELLGIKKEQA